MITPDQVTVIVPCFNSQDCIERAVKSILNQTCTPGKIILIDDVSSDGTYETLLKIQSSHPFANIEVLKNLANSGPGLTRNRGWDVSDSAWIAFLDSDDAWHPSKLEYQIRVLNENQDITLICTQTRFSISSESPVPGGMNLILSSPTFKQLLFKNVIPTRSVMIKRDIPLRFPPGLSEDFALWLQALHLGMTAIKIEAPLAFYFRKEFSPGGVSAALVKHELYELKRLVKYIPDYPFFVTLALSFSILKFFRRSLRRIFRTN
jgi:glycosyltransferase involved in cell wall biosynthesis